MKFTERIVVFSVSVLLLASCSKDPDVEYTSTYKMSGEWFARHYANGAPQTAYHVVTTSNTSDPNSSQVWVDDHLAGWLVKSKFDVDYPNLTFKPMNDVANAATPTSKLKVLEGKVMPEAGRSKSGNTVDSIYIRLEYSNKPGVTYELKGHQRTGFDEDEY
jgi:hypothetical protein